MNPRDARPGPTSAISVDKGPDWADRLALDLIRRAARKAPEALSGRLEEEWLADLAQRPSACSRARFAIGCCWATQVIALEHCGATPALAGHAAGARIAVPFLRGNLQPFSRRSATLALVVGLHIALFYGLMVGLNVNVKKLLTPPLQNLPIPHARPDVSTPPIPPPTLTHTRIDPVPPEFLPTQAAEETGGLVRGPLSVPPALHAETPRLAANRVQGGPGAGFPNPDDFYPSAARRLEEQGMAVVSVCVDEKGRLTSDPTTVQSSGSARLNAGALELAKAGSGHYRASTEDGRPVSACYPFRVRFQLRN